MDQHTEDLLAKVAALGREGRVALIKQLIRQVERDEVEQIFDAVCRVLLPEHVLETWIETRLKGNFGLTPSAVATELRHVKRIDSRYYPHLLELAEKVKHRLRMRIIRLKGTGS